MGKIMQNITWKQKLEKQAEYPNSKGRGAIANMK